MQAALVTGKNKLDLVEIPTPEPGPGKAVVDISFCGICGTDLHAYQSGDPYNPAICGHEWAGSVRAKGSDVTHVKEGDRVAVGISSACGQCAPCKRGDTAYCETAFAGMIGVGPLAATHGGFAPSISVDASRLYGVKNKISDVEAALLEPATVAIHAVRRTQMRLGDTVVVVGAGPIGLLTLQCARAAGAGAIILIEPQASRRSYGEKLGADLLIDPTTENVAESVQKFVGKEGADVVYECAGIPQTINQSVELCRRGGVVSLVGFPNLPAEINAAEWLIKEVELVASLGYLREEFDVAQGLVEDKRLKLAPLHTSTVSLDGIDGAFARLASAPEEVKILVDPRG